MSGGSIKCASPAGQGRDVQESHAWLEVCRRKDGAEEEVNLRILLYVGKTKMSLLSDPFLMASKNE